MNQIKYAILMILLPAFMHGSQQQEITIRAANQKDLVAIAALTRTLFYQDFKPIILTGYADSPMVQAGHVDTILESWISKTNDFTEKTCQNSVETDERTILAENNTKTIVGICAFKKKPAPDENKVYICLLGVNKQCRQEGVGTQLLSKAITTFDSVDTCELAAFAYNNDTVQTFYEKRGFINKGLISLNFLTAFDPLITDTHYLYQRQLKE